MATITLMDLWQLLHPSETFDTRGRYERCFAVWNRWDEAKRTRIYQQIAAKLQNGEFINPNPCFALDDAAQADEMTQAKTAWKKRTQQLSFRDYYTRFGTTEPQDGWQRKYLPEKQTTIYIKN